MKQPLVIRALRGELNMGSLSLPDWELLVRQARSAGVLARLAERIARADDQGAELNAVPQGPRAHLQAALLIARAQRRDVLREIDHVRRALHDLQIPLVLLKGAAYVASGAAAAEGRTFNDIDILVPRQALPAVETALLIAGWQGTHLNAYDQRYYREWMHELPPMVHLRRGTTLDVHHAIMPDTARVRPDSALLLAATQAAASDPLVRVLRPVDMILHSMTHLLHNEEMDHGLRDLSDLDLLMRQHAHGVDTQANPSFWPQLLMRAQALNLQSVLLHGLRQARSLLNTPIPEAVLAEAAQLAGAGRLRLQLSDWMWSRGLSGLHSTVRRPGTTVALSSIYLRAHWMRMPAPLLLRHLANKGWRALFQERASKPM